MSAHTPGDWTVNNKHAYVEAANALAPICSLCWPTPFRSEDQTKANARLIAAAPDLLAALIRCERLLARVTSADSFDNLALQDARAAISKATGEAS